MLIDVGIITGLADLPLYFSDALNRFVGLPSGFYLYLQSFITLVFQFTT